MVSRDFRSNSAGCLRLGAALLVIVSHTWVVGGFGLDPVQRISPTSSLGSLAVGTFFVISGLLITNAALHRPSLWRYGWHRALRILPGYWVCLILLAAGAGPLLWRLEYGTAPYPAAAAGSYVLTNLLGLRQASIGPLLATVPHPGSLDSPFWTLGHELECYAAVALLKGLRLLTRGLVLLLTAALCLFAAAEHLLGSTALASRLDLYSAFGCGACLYLWRDRIALDGRYALTAAVVVLLAVLAPIGTLVLPVALAYVVYYLAYRLPTWCRTINSQTDLSYGLYIYAYPVAQGLALLHLYRCGWLIFLLATLGGAVPLAWLSWRLVEAPALRGKGWRPGAARRSPDRLRSAASHPAYPPR